ncbi:MAG TPA: L-seryl-tRNA(Sec) selenium transferase [Solirubrobacterales bacterium]|nr:L-seryl-tRNA(Sec) selenium transferase [Solirubrobacterales bacterium]
MRPRAESGKPQNSSTRSPVEERLRGLPSVEALAASIDGEPHHLLVAAARTELDGLRARILAGEDVDADPERLRDAVAERARLLRAGTLRRVINATGVVLHTNLGRAPLSAAAAESAARLARGYSNLELDLATGERKSRESHLEPLLQDLTGAEAALAVNNNAAAVLLALAATASGREVVVSRGQLIEIGGSFRIPEILAQSGASLVEVGTTNRTRVEDYERAVGPRTAALMRVHQSNFRTVGFTEEATLEELCGLARGRGLVVIDDLGSGALEPVEDEPTVRASIEAGADLVCCSADKLLGGPQAGIVAGSVEPVALCRSHPLARAFRLDKLQLAALEATLRLHRDRGKDSIPALAMLATPEEELRSRAERMAAVVGEPARVGRSESRPGGGSLPLTRLEGPACVIDPSPIGADELARRLRAAEPVPVLARIEKGTVILDPRTMSDEETTQAAEAARRALE